MKFRVSFKDPDALHDAIEEALDENLPRGLNPKERELVLDVRHDEVAGKLKKWVEHGEYIVIEFDLDAGTATVVPKA